MAKSYQCPSCQNAVDEKATVCSNPSCRAQLAFCLHCRDVVTYQWIERPTSWLQRDAYRCNRCEQEGVKCLTWLTGGYCNGLARAGKRLDRPFCPACSGKAGEVARSIVSWSVIGAFGGLLKKK